MDPRAEQPSGWAADLSVSSRICSQWPQAPLVSRAGASYRGSKGRRTASPAVPWCQALLFYWGFLLFILSFPWIQKQPTASFCTLKEVLKAS